jgi:hypothetical protein
MEAVFLSEVQGDAIDHVVAPAYCGCTWVVPAAGLRLSAQPGRAGASIPQHCPSSVGAVHFSSTCIRTRRKHFQARAELHIPFDFAQGRLSAALGMRRVSVNKGLYWTQYLLSR